MDNNSHRDYLGNLYIQQSEGMYRYAYAVLRDEYLAEEAVQETFAVAWSKINALVTMESPVGWLFGTLKNTMKRTRAEAYKLQKTLVSLDEQLADVPSTQDDLEPLLLFGGIISNDELDLLEKLYVHGFTYKDIADELGVPLSTLGMRAKRAKEKFKRKYGEI